jgi:CheY-like chemotaxis protein
MLADIMMPVMDGSQMLERMRSKPHLDGIAVVMMSAARTPGTGDSRVVAFLQKPFNLDMVLHVLQRAATVQADGAARDGTTAG